MKCKLQALTHSSIFWPCKDGYLCWQADCCHMAGTLCSIFSQIVQDWFCSLAPGAKPTLLGHREMPNIVVEFKTCSFRTRKQLQCLTRKMNHVQQRTRGGNVSAKSSAGRLLLCQVHGFNADAWTGAQQGESRPGACTIPLTQITPSSVMYIKYTALANVVASCKHHLFGEL